VVNFVREQTESRQRKAAHDTFAFSRQAGQQLNYSGFSNPRSKEDFFDMSSNGLSIKDSADVCSCKTFQLGKVSDGVRTKGGWLNETGHFKPRA
jgi:hypothetical protein